MPARRKKERIAGTYFVWLLGRRKGVYYADGRSNTINVGRHSLGATDHKVAISALGELDRVKAVEHGLADRSILAQGEAGSLDLATGCELYMNHANRPRVLGGVRPNSAKRYRPVLEKFQAFALAEGVATWNQVTKAVVEAYAAHLDDEGYAYATEYLELTTLKQVIKWHVEEGRLPPASLFRLTLAKPQGTTTYCWRPEEVQAMVRLCREDSELQWLWRVLVALCCTGLRISQLASLRWSDIDRKRNLIELKDESRRAKGRQRSEPRRTKSGRGRTFPIHEDLLAVLDTLTPLKDGLVFHGPLGGKIKPDTVRRTLVRDVLAPLGERFPSREEEIGFKDGRLHSFRHYFCSACANGGVPEQVVMEWLGHRDSAMVRHYYHLHDEEAQRQMRRLSFLGESGGGVAVGDGS